MEAVSRHKQTRKSYKEQKQQSDDTTSKEEFGRKREIDSRANQKMFYKNTKEGKREQS